MNSMHLSKSKVLTLEIKSLITENGRQPYQAHIGTFKK